MPIKLRKEHLVYMGIGNRYWESSYNSMTVSQKDSISQYLKKMKSNILDGTGMFLWGDNSSGKTYVASVLCKLVWKRYRVASYFITASDLYKAWIKDYPANPESEESVLYRIKNVRFLVLDDMGREYRTHSGFSEVNFGSLLRARSNMRKTTVITSNLSPKEFSDVYGRAAGELAKESLDIVRLSGENHRDAIMRERRLDV